MNHATRQRIYRTGILIAATSALLAGCSSSNIKGDWVEVFNGRNLDDWKAMHPENNTWQLADHVEPAAADETKLAITDGTGIMVNGPLGKTTNIFSTLEHGDARIHVEFAVPKDSNSGVYVMGKYEVQILDSYGKDEVTFSDCGGIYARWIDGRNVDGHAPRVNASNPPGEWQTYEIWFKAPRFDENGKKTANARFIKVVHNGQVVHEDVELKGPTRSAMPGPESPTGPIMLQGDHGPVAYRNIRMRPMCFDE